MEACDNPFVGILKMMNKKADERQPTYFSFGIVTSGEDSGNLTVKVGEMQYLKSAGDLMRFVSCAGCGLCSSCMSCEHTSFSGSCKMKINSGDKVLCVSMDNGQSIIVISKLE